MYLKYFTYLPNSSIVLAGLMLVATSPGVSGLVDYTKIKQP